MSGGGTATAAAAFRRPEFVLFAGLAAAAAARFLFLLPAPLREAEQIVNTGILLAVLALYLVIDFRPRLAGEQGGDPKARYWGTAGLFLAAGTFALAPSLPSLLLLFAGFCCLLRAAAGALLDPESRILLNPLLAAFLLFGALLLALPLLDMPLRVLAGRWSAQLLDWLQQDTELGFVRNQGEWMLLLIVNGRPFHVAAECNGFGLLGTSLILTAAFAFYRRTGWLDALLLLLAAAFLAVLGNLVRILVIIFLAPRVGDHYLLMHEIVGTIAFYGFLAIQWWLIMGFGRSPRPPRLETA